MANIDVTEIFDDPDFMDEIEVRRPSTAVNADGVMQTTATRFAGVLASVQPASGKALMFLPEAQRTQGALQIWTKFQLIAATPAGSGDYVLWQGQTYLIEVILPWSNYGAGFCSAVMMRKEVSPNEPNF
jgi:hypothetical protein